MNRDRKILLAITACGLIARVAAFGVWPALSEQDTDGYLGIAESLVEGNGYANGATGRSTAFRPPLFPALIALFSFLPFGFQILQVGAGTVSVWLTGIIGNRLRIRLPWLPAAAVAFDPILIAYTPRAMTEVVSALTIAVLLWMLGPIKQKPTCLRTFCVGFVFGLAVLCRPTVLAVLPFAGLILLLETRHIARGDVFRRGICAIGGAATLIAPWTARNVVALKSPVFATTHGGYTLLLGNNPEFYETVARGSWKTVWNSLPWQAALRDDLSASNVDVEDEVAVDRWMYDRAKSNIRSDPSSFVAACVVRVRRLWNF
ncbi:MAG: ArnT family glycosyltransferase, partial [Planctomycetaceae bacterium]